MHVDDDQKWSTYVTPKMAIESETEKKNGISMKTGQLTRHGKPVDAVNITTAITQFMEFLERQPKRVLLLTHDAYQYNNRVLISAIERTDMRARFKKPMFGYLDTVFLFNKEKHSLPTYRIPALAKRYLDAEDYDNYDAALEAAMLKRLVEFNFPDGSILNPYMVLWW